MDAPAGRGAGVPLALHRSPAAGFDEPFEMLAACHERVDRMLRLLQRLGAHLAVQGADTAAAEAARDLMRYFDQAAPQHHEDEERHVVPRLRAAGHVAAADRIVAEHRRMAAAWQALREQLVEIEHGRWPRGAAAPGAGFAELHRAHIQHEDRVAFPVAAAASDAAARATMGTEMAARRGLR